MIQTIRFMEELPTEDWFRKSQQLRAAKLDNSRHGLVSGSYHPVAQGRQYRVSRTSAKRSFRDQNRPASLNAGHFAALPGFDERILRRNAHKIGVSSAKRGSPSTSTTAAAGLETHGTNREQNSGFVRRLPNLLQECN